jgi:hypothetical protein
MTLAKIKASAKLQAFLEALEKGRLLCLCRFWQNWILCCCRSELPSARAALTFCSTPGCLCELLKSQLATLLSPSHAAFPLTSFQWHIPDHSRGRLSHFKDPCDQIGPIQVIQDNLIARTLITPAHIPGYWD